VLSKAIEVWGVFVYTEGLHCVSNNDVAISKNKLIDSDCSLFIYL